MISAKLAALCLCPALAATPALIATHPKARHAVAHILHRAADGLEAPVAAAPVRFASAPCAPSFGTAPLSAGLAAPISTAVEVSTFGVEGLPIPVTALGGNDVPGLTSFNPGGSSGVGGVGGSSAGIGAGGTSGAGAGSPGIAPTPVDGVTEPQNWALLVTGLGATGVLLRARRTAAA